MNPSDSLSEQVATYSGLSRLRYFFSIVGLHVVFFLIVVTVGKSQPLVANLSVLALVAGMFTLAALRFRNQGASGWWAIGHVVP